MFEEYRKSTEDGLKIPDEFDELINEINGKNNEKKDDKTNDNYVEVNLNLFTIENGKIKILLLKKKDEPYKNHLVLPSETLKSMEDVSKKIENIIYFDLKLDDIYFKQSYFSSNIKTSTNNNSISLSYIGIINIDEFNKSVDKNILYSWFPIDDLPKIEFDYSKIIKEVQKQENTNQKYSIDYGYHHFPEKIYKGVKYQEGNYESLLITLGQGKGDNWWCVLFPPICSLVTNVHNTKNIEYSLYVKEMFNKYIK